MKNKFKKNVLMLNIFSNILLQFVTIISGFIIPRIILSSFGSEVNGLVSSLNQFLSYINLFEGGLGAVVLANLYKPLTSKDDEKISSVVNTTASFYRKIAIIFLIYTLLVAIIYPFITKTSFSFIYIVSLTIILSLNLFIQYNFSLSYKLLLQADKKVYIVSFTQILLTILNVLMFVIIAKVYPNIHIMKLGSAIVFLLQPLIFNIYVNKHYKINKNIEKDTNLLKSRWDGFAINIAAFIHNNTDITVLTILTNLKTVSVYAVYALVTGGLKRLISAISSAVSPSIGHVYAKGNTEELNKKFDLYEYSIFLITFFLFTVGDLLITPFVIIYTKGINDINYNQNIFGIILVLSELMYCIREPYVNLVYSANKFKDIKKHAYIEAICNIVISVILVYKFGLIGVAIGTLISMTYRTLFHVFYLRNHIINRSIKYFIGKFLSFGIASIIGILICNYLIPFNDYTIIKFIIYGVLYSFIIGILYLIISIIFYKNNLKYLIKKK